MQLRPDAQRAGCAWAGKSSPGRGLLVQTSLGIRIRMVLVSYRLKHLGCNFLRKVIETCCFGLDLEKSPSFVVDFPSLFSPSCLVDAYTDAPRFTVGLCPDKCI